MTLRRTAARLGKVPELARRMRAVREPLAFALAEVRREPAMACYRLRDPDVVCCIRHHTNDVGALDDVMLAREYDPPPPLAPWLRHREGLRVLDLGGHVGLFALDVASRYPGATITALEPDGDNAAVYRETLRRNGLTAQVELLDAAAATSDGTVRFQGGLGVSSHVAPDDSEWSSGQGRDVPAVDVLPLMLAADLVKMDVEGAEWALLADPRAAQALGPAVVLEYHDHACPEPDAERAAVRALEGAGLRVWPVRRGAGMGVLWAFDPALV